MDREHPLTDAYLNGKSTETALQNVITTVDESL